MKSILILFIILFYTTTAITNNLDIQELQVPNSPAFILLDVAPSVVDKPNTAKALSTSVLSAINENGGIPQNYAVEFTPFWFIKHHSLTAQKYYGYDPETGKSKIFSQAPAFSVSIAYVQTQVTDSSNVRNIAGGLKTTLIRARSKSECTELKRLNDKLHDAKESAKAAKKLEEASIAFQKVELKNKKDRTPQEDAKLAKLRKQLKEIRESRKNAPEVTKLIDSIKTQLSHQPLFSLEFAFACNVSFDKDEVSSGDFDRLGLWLTPNFTFNKNKNATFYHLYGTFRYLNEDYISTIDMEHNRRNLIDMGGKFELEVDRFEISAEAIARIDLEDNKNNTNRFSGLAKYRLKEGLYLTSAFGKNFGEKDNLITQVGIDVGVGGNKTSLASSI